MSEYDDLIRSGKVYYDKGEYDLAIAELNKAIEFAPDYSSAYNNRGIVYGRKGDYDLAIADYSKVIGIDPNDSNAYINRGIVYGKKDEHDLAIADYGTAIELAPNDLKAYFKRGNAYYDKGEYNGAIADYSNVIEINPNYSGVYNSRAAAYYRKGDYNSAIDDLNNAIKFDPEHEHVGFYFNRGTVFSANDDYDSARKDFTKAMTILFESDSELPDRKSSHFFINLIMKFKKEGYTAVCYQELIISVHSLWNLRRYRNNGEIKKIYQYTSQAVLNNMKETRRLWLTPTCYQNDPEEGFVFYEYLRQMLNEDDGNQQNKEILENLKNEVDSSVIAFIRSFSRNKDSLVMWDSSYGQNGEGVSIGISPKKLDKGNGLNSSSSKESSEFKLEQTGLYEILYLDKEKINDSQQNDDAKRIMSLSLLEEIKNTLIKIPSEDWNEKDDSVLLPLLSELFTCVNHLIKDSSYEHEHEYRLMHIGSIEDDKDFIKSSVNTGIYIETEPILFNNPDDKEIIYFGPKVDTITFKRAEHAFEHEALKSGRVTAEIKKSEKQYR